MPSEILLSSDLAFSTSLVIIMLIPQVANSITLNPYLHLCGEAAGFFSCRKTGNHCSA